MYQGKTSTELCTIQQDDAGAYSGANIYMPGVQRLGVATANYVCRVQDKGKDFQVTTKQGQLLAEVCSLACLTDSLSKLCALQEILFFPLLPLKVW